MCVTIEARGPARATPPPATRHSGADRPRAAPGHKKIRVARSEPTPGTRGTGIRGLQHVVPGSERPRRRRDGARERYRCDSSLDYTEHSRTRHGHAQTAMGATCDIMIHSRFVSSAGQTLN